MGTPIERISQYFEKPGKVSLKKELLPPVGRNQVMIKTIISSINAGTEMLFYRGQVPENIPVDASFPLLAKKFTYPIKYGYSVIGKVIEPGKKVSPVWLGKNVFSFHCHENAFCDSVDNIVQLPEGLAQEDAIFLPAMETALTVLHDAAPRVGENMLVIGQGIIGLLTTILLHRLPALLVSLDKSSFRRETSQLCGAQLSLNPDQNSITTDIKSWLQKHNSSDSFDLVIELSGEPAALEQAIALAGKDGRIVVGSWYGKKRYPFDLGSLFHRNRLTIISSQVSSPSARMIPAWTKRRRTETVLKLLGAIKPSRFISHRFPIQKAAQAYRLLDTHPEQTLQVIFEY